MTARPFDYESFQDDILGRLQVRYAATFNDFAVSSLAVMLLDSECYGLDALGYYLDDRVGESFLATATTRGSVSRICRQLGYPMRGAVPATLEVSVSVPDASSVAVTLPAGFQLQGPGDRVFEVASPVTFLPVETGGAAVKSVPTVEGTSQQETFVSNGAPAQAFQLRRIPDGKFVASGSVAVRVNGTAWEENFSFRASAQEYEVAYNDEPPTVRFGDGVAGAIPPSGATITIRYRVCSGAAGRTEQGLVTAPVTDLVVGLTTVPLTIASPNRTVGGDDPESIEEAKRNAPLYRRSRDVVVTREDYENAATSFADPVAGRVAVAQASSVRSAAGDLALLNQLAAIRSAAGASAVPVAAATASLRSHFSDIADGLTRIDLGLGAVANEVSRLSTASSNLQTATRTVEVSASSLAPAASTQGTHVTAIRSTLSAFTLVSSPTPEQIRQATLDALTSRLDSIQAGVGTITTAGGAISAQVSSLVAQIATLRDILGVLGDLVTPSTTLGALAADRAAIAAEIGSTSPAAGAYADVLAIEAVVVDAAASNYADVDAACQEIYNHVDRMLAADGQANLVTVPILAMDSAGFYVAPSPTLLAALQAHLDARKGTTQTVSVVSGAAFLLPVSLSVRVGVVGVSAVLMQSAVGAVVDSMLRGRRFGVPLYHSDVWRALQSLAGVRFVNVSIDGYVSGSSILTDRLDGSGNLIPRRAELVTKGNVYINVESAGVD